MRYYFMLILIPPTILSLWTMYQVYSRGVMSTHNVHKKFFLIINQSEVLLKNMVKTKNGRNIALTHSVPTRRNAEISRDSVTQLKKDQPVSKSVSIRTTDSIMATESVTTQTKDKINNSAALTQTINKVVRDSGAKESNIENDWTTTLKAEEKGITSETVIDCPKDGENLAGPLMVDRSTVNSMKDLELEFSGQYEGGWVKQGGAWKPQHCRALKKVAIILPYRNRYEQLKIFLRHLHPIFKRQLLDYRIFIVEQSGDTVFNRAILFNIGFKEVQKFNNYQCFVFHDVDLLPEDDNNMYNCPTSPRHMCPAVDKFFYRLPYKELFGGVEAIWKEHFEKVNGFSNKYWGWGGEDDDLYHRCNAKGLKLTRPSMKTGRYQMLKEHHHIDDRKDKKRTRQLLNGAVPRMTSDGLNTLKYSLLETNSHPLYTHIKVEVDPDLV